MWIHPTIPSKATAALDDKIVAYLYPPGSPPSLQAASNTNDADSAETAMVEMGGLPLFFYSSD